MSHFSTSSFLCIHPCSAVFLISYNKDKANYTSQQSKLNCEVLHEESAYEIRWSVVESGETIVFQLVGRLDSGNYMAFGLSGEEDRSSMLGGDAMIGWFDQTTGRANVVDYFLGGKSVCKQDNSGTCPDSRLKDGLNNVRLLSAASVNGFTILTFQRKLKAMDALDRQILTNQSQPIIWAIGKMQHDLPGYHYIRGDDFSVDFGRLPKWNCPEPQMDSDFGSPTSKPETVPVAITPKPVKGSDSSLTPIKRDPDAAASIPGISALAHPSAWTVPPIRCHEPEDGVYYIHVGPPGRQDIFRTATGRQEVPPYVWYVNGLLMPEINLVRHRNYTFVVQGGKDGFYITSDTAGDYQHKSETFKKQETIFAGVELSPQGKARPTALGKLCRWIGNGSHPAEFFASYAAYQRSLNLECGRGHSGMLHFTPDANTPNTVFYQSYSQKNMGWKIRVLDECRSGSKGGENSQELLNRGGTAATNVDSTQVLPQQPHQQDQAIEESILRPAFVPISVPLTSNGNINLVPHNHQQQHALSLKEVQLPMFSAHPAEKTYVIDTTLASQFQPFDSSRLIWKGKPLEQMGSDKPSRQPLLSMAPGNNFQLPQTPGLYQFTIDASGTEGRHQQQNEFQLVDSHFLKRIGPLTPINTVTATPRPFRPSMLPFVERSDGGGYGRPEFILASSRLPPSAFGPDSGQQFIQVTRSPPSQESPLAEMIMRNVQSGRMNLPNGSRKPSGEFQQQPSFANYDGNGNMKFAEPPSRNSGNVVQIFQNDGRYNAPLLSPNWMQTKTLPKHNSRNDPTMYLRTELLRGEVKRQSGNRITRAQ